MQNVKDMILECIRKAAPETSRVAMTNILPVIGKYALEGSQLQIRYSHLERHPNVDCDLQKFKRKALSTMRSIMEKSSNYASGEDQRPSDMTESMTEMDLAKQLMSRSGMADLHERYLKC